MEAMFGGKQFGPIIPGAALQLAFRFRDGIKVSKLLIGVMRVMTPTQNFMHYHFGEMPQNFPIGFSIMLDPLKKCVI